MVATPSQCHGSHKTWMCGQRCNFFLFRCLSLTRASRRCRGPGVHNDACHAAQRRGCYRDPSQMFFFTHAFLLRQPSPTLSAAAGGGSLRVSSSQDLFQLLRRGQRAPAGPVRVQGLCGRPPASRGQRARYTSDRPSRGRWRVYAVRRPSRQPHPPPPRQGGACHRGSKAKRRSRRSKGLRPAAWPRR